MKANAVALLGIAETSSDFWVIAVLVIPKEEGHRTALLVGRLHGEGSLVIGRGERVSKPTVVLLGAVPLPEVEDGAEAVG